MLSGSFPSRTRIVGLATARRLCFAPRAVRAPGRVIVVIVAAIVAIGRRSSVVASSVDRVPRREGTARADVAVGWISARAVGPARVCGEVSHVSQYACCIRSRYSRVPIEVVILLMHTRTGGSRVSCSRSGLLVVSASIDP